MEIKDFEKDKFIKDFLWWFSNLNKKDSDNLLNKKSIKDLELLLKQNWFLK
jgi:hypothetical protein